MTDAQTPPAWSQVLKNAALSATAAASFFTSFGAMSANAPNAPQDNWQQQPVSTDVQQNVEKSATPVLDEKLKNLSGKPPSAEESVIGAYRAPDGKVTIKNIAGDPDQNHDYASVGKMVSIGYMDERVQDKTINLKDKILPQYAKEFNLPPDTTYGDAMKATYYYSNNDTAQAMFKSAMHEKHNFHDSVHVSNTQVAEELSGYMKENGFTHSFQSNAAGYPEWSDEASKAYSAPGIPSRSTGYRPGELANFMVNKYCEGTGHTISDETANLLDLDVKQAPFSVPINNKGVARTEITSRGIQETARTEYDDPEITSRFAKAGNSNNAKSGTYAFNYNDHSCRVVLAGGKVENRETRLPKLFDDFVEQTPTPKPPPNKGPGVR